MHNFPILVDSTLERPSLDTLKGLVDGELLLSADAIKRNPKSCMSTQCVTVWTFIHCVDGAWDHRRWVFQHVISPLLPIVSEDPSAPAASRTSFLMEELQLCRLLLKEDERNFHCWNYRRFVVSLQTQVMKQIEASETPQELWERLYGIEMKFSMEKVLENFSNYSAYHHRSVYLKEAVQLLEQGTDRNREDVYAWQQAQAETEFSLVENAMFTEPDDQSIWWYYQFLLEWLAPDTLTTGTDRAEGAVVPGWEIQALVWFAKRVAHMKQQLEELREVESSSKWVQMGYLCTLDTLCNVERVWKALETFHPAAVQAWHAEHGADEESILEELHMNDQWRSLRVQLLQSLQSTDPWHQCRYDYLTRMQCVN